MLLAHLTSPEWMTVVAAFAAGLISGVVAMLMWMRHRLVTVKAQVTRTNAALDDSSDR